jgi:hypothetical protein
VPLRFFHRQGAIVSEDASVFRWIQFGRDAPARYGLSAAAANVIKSLAMHADVETGQSWPSVSTLAAECSLAESTVKAAIRELKTVGALTAGWMGRRYVWTLIDAEPRHGVTGKAIARMLEERKPSKKSGTPDRSGTPDHEESGVPDYAWSGTPDTEVPVLKSQYEEHHLGGSAGNRGIGNQHGPLDETWTEPIARARAGAGASARARPVELDIRRLQGDGTLSNGTDWDLWEQRYDDEFEGARLEIRNKAKMRAAISRFARENVDGIRLGKFTDSVLTLAFQDGRNGVVTVDDVRQDILRRRA